MTSTRFYVGTFTHSRNLPVGPEQGIFWYQLDLLSGKLTFEGAADAGPDPAFQVLSADGQFLYTVNEVAEFRGHSGGGVSAFSVNPQTGGLSFLNSQPSFGVSPCYISLDKTGKWAMVSNYMGGNLSIYPVLGKGYLGPASDFIQHEGHGPNAERQEKAHVHSIQTDPANRLALAADLGLDQVKVYQFDLAAGKLRQAAIDAIGLHPGAGPRHFAFHPNEKWLYVINELDSSLVVFSVDWETTDFRPVQTISALPEGYTGEKWAADIHVHPNGKFVYVSNRAHDSLAGFSIDPSTGRVQMVSVIASGGRTPRNFAIDPSGRWLLAANQNGDNVVVFAIDPASGALASTGIEISVPNPVCITFAQ